MTDTSGVSQPADPATADDTKRARRARRLGGLIRRYRIAAKLSQPDLAARLGVVPSCISDWERGDTSPKMARLVDVAKILGVGVGDLIGGR